MESIFDQVIAVILGLLAIAGGYITYTIRRQLPEMAENLRDMVRANENQHPPLLNDILEFAADMAVDFVEQVSTTRDEYSTNLERRNAAVHAAERILSENGVRVSRDVLDTAIEASVHRSNRYRDTSAEQESAQSVG